MNSVKQSEAIERLQEELAETLKRVGYLERQVEHLKRLADSHLNRNLQVRLNRNLQIGQQSVHHNWPE